MSKRVVLFFAGVFGIVGGYTPAIFGDNDLLDGWSILGGLAGGLLGVWAGAYVSKRWG